MILYYIICKMSEGEESKEKAEDKEIKAILLGNSGVGKTNLINTCVGKPFDEEKGVSTTGSYSQKEVIINDKKYCVNLWDTAGQELYNSITKMFLKKSKIVIFVYDITDKASFINLEKWINMCKDVIDNPYISGIVGNKMDLFVQEQVNEEEARKYAESKGMNFQLVSAKENPKPFELFLKKLVEDFKEPPNHERIESITINSIDNGEKKDKCNC